MSIADDCATVLEADNGAGGVATLLTGGIYTFAETGELGISRDTTPNAFNATTGLLKPCCVIRVRGQNYDNGPRDIGVASYRQVVELWFYNDRSATYATIESARTRCIALLDEKMLGTSKQILRWSANPINDAQDPALDNARMIRADYDTRGLL